MKQLAQSVVVKVASGAVTLLTPNLLQARTSIIENDLTDPSRTTLYDVTQILTYIIQFGLAFAGAVAAIFIVVSGYQYIIAAGNPEKLEKAKMGLTWAISGFIIAASSYAIVILVQGALKAREPVSQFGNRANRGVTSPQGVLVDIFDLLLLLAGAVAVIFLIVGGYRYMTSRGNEDHVESAKRTVLYSVIGLAVVFVAFLAVALVGQLVGKK